MIKFLNAVLCIGVAVILTAPDGQAAKKGGSKSSGGGKGSCTSDIPITWQIVSPAPTWTFSDGTTTGPAPSATPISGDGISGNSYSDGGSGVTRSVINICSGTGDATLLLDTSSPTRSITVSFTTPFATNLNTPTFATQQPQTLSGYWFLNVRNLWYNHSTPNDNSTEYTFTTRFTSGAPPTGTAHLRMLNSGDEAVTSTPNGAANDPYQNSLVDVYHCPYPAVSQSGPCARVSAETWYVWSDSTSMCSSSTPCDPTPLTTPVTAVASLILDGKPHTGSINAGEFSIPFYFIITRQ